MSSTQNIQWIINNATRANVEKYNILTYRKSSDHFNINLDDDIIEWNLYFFTDKEWFQLFLCNVKRKVDFIAMVSFELCDKKKGVERIRSDDFQQERCGWNQLIKLDELFLKENGYIDQNDRLVINLKITMTKCSIAPQQEDDLNESFLREDYREFLNEDSYSDCSFTTSDNEKVPGHRVILIKRSSGFKKILEEMKAQKRKTRVFENIDSETLKAVLSFIYTGNVTLSPNSTSVIRVLTAAVKFEIEDLKSLCIETLINQITSENVLDLLDVAVDKDLAKLEAESMKFIMSHVHQLKSTVGWELLQPRLRNKIFEAFSGYIPSIVLESTL